jgi:hypothetical protein
VLLLITKAHPSMVRYAHPNLGRLVVPRDHARVADTAAAGIEWAADNGAYSGLDELAFGRMLDRLQGVPGCRFVVAPDRVGDAAATLELFERWQPEIAGRGLPVALAAQNGLERLDVPWGRLDALFVGGVPDQRGADWKLGPAAAALVGEARARGKWAHMGRVNSHMRSRWAAAIGCQSTDGTKYARFPLAHLARALQVAGDPVQLPLELH